MRNMHFALVAVALLCAAPALAAHPPNPTGLVPDTPGLSGHSLNTLGADIARARVAVEIAFADPPVDPFCWISYCDPPQLPPLPEPAPGPPDPCGLDCGPGLALIASAAPRLLIRPG